MVSASKLWITKLFTFNNIVIVLCFFFFFNVLVLLKWLSVVKKMNASSSDIFYFYTELLKNRLNLLMENGLSRLLSLYIHSCVKLFKSITTKLLTKQSKVFIIMFFTNIIYCNITYRLLVMLDTLLVIQPPEHFFIYIRPVHTQKKHTVFLILMCYLYFIIYIWCNYR